MIASIQAIGNWDAQIGVPLETALAASVDLVGTTGEKACRKAMWFMAESCQKQTKSAARTRPVDPNPQFTHLLRKSQYKVARMAGKDMSHYYRNRASKYNQPPKPHSTLYLNQDVSFIKNRGLAVRSWQWGLAALGKGGRTRRGPIREVVELYTIYGERNAGPLTSSLADVAGYRLQNRLSYVQEAMPAGWEADVHQKVANRIMGEARQTLRRLWVSEMMNADAALIAARGYEGRKGYMTKVTAAGNAGLAKHFEKFTGRGK